MRWIGSNGSLAISRSEVPTGVAAFRDPVFLPPPRSFAEKTYNIVHWADMPRGGHFAAWEEPDLMLADLRAFIATVSEERS
jgi:pimeloyl-ACP methyl ester carboxylesterase